MCIYLYNIWWLVCYFFFIWLDCYVLICCDGLSLAHIYVGLGSNLICTIFIDFWLLGGRGCIAFSTISNIETDIILLHCLYNMLGEDSWVNATNSFLTVNYLYSLTKTLQSVYISFFISLLESLGNRIFHFVIFVIPLCSNLLKIQFWWRCLNGKSTFEYYTRGEKCQKLFMPARIARLNIIMILYLEPFPLWSKSSMCIYNLFSLMETCVY